jgi:hypothetical protein
MSDLSSIVQITISRDTQAVKQESFGVFAIISEFLTSKTTETFGRYRYYSSLAEMVTDGWSSSDAEYDAAAYVFGQNPSVEQIMIGRMDDIGTGDADIPTALTAIQAASSNWYAWMIIPPGTYADDVKAAALWNNSQKKLFFCASGSTAVLSSAISTDLASVFKTASYDRTSVFYHQAAQDATPTPSTISYPEAGWPGEALPYDPGSQTWAYKTISLLTASTLTTTQQTTVRGKNCNFYTQKGGVNVTLDGVVSSGEYIDIIRGLDWLESSLETAVFSNLVNTRKIPFTDSGISIIENTIRGVLLDAAAQGLITEDSIVVTVPLASSVSTANKIARILPDVEFSATLQGAIHTIQISGVVSV